MAPKIQKPTARNTRPLLKWAGGKRALTDEITPLLKGFDRYYEPFFGGGAVFFDLAPENSVLGDLNPELINCYKVTQTKPDELIEKLRKLKNTAETYYQVRASVPRSELAPV